MYYFILTGGIQNEHKDHRRYDNRRDTGYGSGYCTLLP